MLDVLAGGEVPALLAHGTSAGGSGDGLPAFGPWTVFTQAHLEPVPALTVLVLAVLYVWGVVTLRRRGDAWPVGRSIAFLLLGLGTFALATMSGVAAYDDSLFSVHMLQHMVLAMVTPVFLALGAPITLALRTLPRSGRRVLLTVLHSRVVKVLTFPAIPWIVFVANPFVLYFSGLYQLTLEHDLLHQALHLHFLAAGCLFFWPLLGIDPIPGRVGYPMRMLLAAATLPFHAFLGVAIMSAGDRATDLIAGSYYLQLHPLSEVASQQQLGGALLWASGDLVGLLFVFTMAYQWMRASEREAAREDRRLDRLEAAERAALAAQAPAGG